MNTEDKLKAICNYTHKDQATQLAQLISYIEFETFDILKKKQAKRNLLINELLDIEEESNYTESGLDLDSEYDTISPKIKQASVMGQAHTSVEAGRERLLDDVIKKIVADTATPHPMLTKITLSTDSTKSLLENSQTMARRVLTRIMAASNKIAVEGRRGPGKSMLVSPKTELELRQIDIDQYMTGFSMPRIVDQRIPDGRIILCRGGDAADPGIIAMTTQTATYMHATNDYIQQYAWFEIELNF